MKFAEGGFINGPSASVRLERLGFDAEGHCLYKINGGEPEHIATAEALRSGDVSALTCTLREVSA